MRILLASDHAGFEMKNDLCLFLKEKGYEVVDYGPHELDPEDDYPDFVAPLAEEISRIDTDNEPINADEETRGIIVGGSGQGEAIMANRFTGVRAVVFNGEYQPRGRNNPDEIVLSRQHNNANILSLGARFLNIDEAKEAVEKWLTTPFSNEERHSRRIQKIEELAPKNS